MDEYEIACEIKSLQKRIEKLEADIEEIEEFEIKDCEKRAKYLNAKLTEESNLLGENIEQIEFSFGSMWCHGMEHISSKLILYSNGTFRSETTLKDHSGHRKYGNSVVFSLIFSNGTELCTVSGLNGNFSPGEEKSYTTSGDSQECVNNNFELIKKGDLIPYLRYGCCKRNQNIYIKIIKLFF